MIPFKTFILPKIHCGINRMNQTKIEEKIEVASDYEHAETEDGFDADQLVSHIKKAEPPVVKPWYHEGAQKIERPPYDPNIDKLEENLAKHYSKFDPAHIARIRSYTSNSEYNKYNDVDSTNYSFRYINRRILNGKFHPDDDYRMKSMDEVLNVHKTPHPLTVYSGVAVNHAEEVLHSDKVRHSAYLSTSLSPGTAMSFSENYRTAVPKENDRHILQIHLPEGHPGAYIDHHSSCNGEQEFVLPRETVLKIDHSKRQMMRHDYGESGSTNTFIHHAYPVPE
jgi:hypothetical protein